MNTISSYTAEWKVYLWLPTNCNPCYRTAQGTRIPPKYSSIIRDCKTGAMGRGMPCECWQYVLAVGRARRVWFGPIGKTSSRIWVEWLDTNQLCIQIYRRSCSHSVNLAIRFSLWLALITAYVFISKISHTQKNYRSIQWMWLVNIVGGQRDNQT